LLDSVAAIATEVRLPAPALSSVTVALPPPRPAEKVAGAGPDTTIALRFEESPTAPEVAVAKIQRLAAEGVSPRLERLSLGEVALVTTNRPVWTAQVVQRSRVSTTVRWVPIQTAALRPNIRLLNAAQHRGLAARSRRMLFDRGWRRMEIGVSTEIREQSVVLYPASRRMLGRSLAAQFGFRSQPNGQSDVLIVLLGRDAAILAGRQKRG
jgi:hypothetical protein